MYLSFNHILEVMKNTTYIEKCLEFDVVTYILTFTKRILYLTLRKNRVLLKKGVFYWASKSAILLEKGVFFRPKSAKRGCFSNLGTSVVNVLVGSRGGIPYWRWYSQPVNNPQHMVTQKEIVIRVTLGWCQNDIYGYPDEDSTFIKRA